MPTEFSRRQFLETLAAAAGVTLLAGCTSSDSAAPAPAGGAGTALTAIAGSDGSFVVPGAGSLTAGNALGFTFPSGEAGLVFVTTAGKNGALSAKCTHSGCTVEWRPSAGKDALHCPCHDSVFEPNGANVSGPAKKPLARYNVKIQGKDAVLTAA